MKRCRTRGRLAVPLVLCTLLLLGAGCGIPLDAAPRSIPSVQDQRAAEPVPFGPSTVAVYYVRGNHITAAMRDAPDDELSTVLDLLTARSGTNPITGPVSLIPAGTRILSQKLSGRSLQIDLSGEFANVVGAGRQLAIAQIVLTATDSRQIDSIRFSIDGQPTSISSPVRGDSRAATPCDFLPLIADDAQITEDGTGPDAARRLSFRRKVLQANCPIAKESPS